jgi:hypothetical protein
MGNTAYTDLQETDRCRSITASSAFQNSNLFFRSHFIPIHPIHCHTLPYIAIHYHIGRDPQAGRDPCWAQAGASGAQARGKSWGLICICQQLVLVRRPGKSRAWSESDSVISDSVRSLRPTGPGQCQGHDRPGTVLGNILEGESKHSEHF